jgi:hydrogenase maturation protein HypF
VVGGRVQGVGYRPFVYRCAQRYQLSGWVRNHAGRVEIEAQGDAAALDALENALVADAPPLARPKIVLSAAIAVDKENRETFHIRPSAEGDAAHAHVPPDYFTCGECLEELHRPTDRRYRYPFINCTQCGPRYTVIQRLPYDRPNTSLAGFPLCPACRHEYTDPLDRRFHAEPLACPVCGPRLQYYGKDTGLLDDTAAALKQCVMALQRGFIVAVKGVGGYHLMCDAANERAIGRLRLSKPRPHKPLAVMFPLRGADGLDAVRDVALLAPEHASLLLDPMRPIVLVPLRTDPLRPTLLAPAIAPNLADIGVMLPYSPLHHLLLNDFGGALVATSANRRGEPVLTEKREVEQHLGHVADAFLHHNRPILRPADDPVYRVIEHAPRPLRLGRGNAPLELTLPFSLPQPLLAVGAHMKNTVALAWENRCVISPHIGDLETPRSQDVFQQVIADLQSLYAVQAARVVCDAHPGYFSTQWAARSGLPLQKVFHHMAHASALAGEFPEVGHWLVFTWDGVGYGQDGTLWGGEALCGRPGHWRRAASLRPFRLPGGHKASREPWRSALALCWEAGMPWPDGPQDTGLLRAAWQRGLNSPSTTSVGRLFDAAAALIGLTRTASYEGQGPMQLEAIASADAAAVTLPLARNAQQCWESDWSPLLAPLLDTRRSASERAGMLHHSLAEALCRQAMAVRAQTGVDQVGLSGGVFQNQRLTQRACALLRAQGFTVYLGRAIACNDAGICYGQIVESAHTAVT